MLVFNLYVKTCVKQTLLFLTLLYCTCIPIKNIKMNSFKSSENIQKKEGGPDRSVSDNQSSSVALLYIL